MFADNKLISSWRILSAVRSSTKSPNAIYRRIIKFRRRKLERYVRKTRSDRIVEYRMEFMAHTFELICNCREELQWPLRRSNYSNKIITLERVQIVKYSSLNKSCVGHIQIVNSRVSSLLNRRRVI